MKTQEAWTATHKHNNELVIIEGSDECLCSLSELGLQFSISTSEQIVPARLVYGADSIAEFEEMRDKAQKYENLQAEIEKRAARVFDTGKDGE